MKPILLALALAVPLRAAADDCTPSMDERPDWASEAPRGYKFDYFVGQADDDHSATRARGAAVGAAVASLVNKGRVDLSATTTAKQSELTVDEKTQRISDVSQEIVMKGHSTTVEGLEQVEFYEEECGGTYRVFALVRLPRRQELEPPGAMEPVWRSAIGPGWGQIYKGYKKRGIAILASELVLVPTAIITFNLSSDAAVEASLTSKQSERDFWLGRRDTFYVVSIAAFAAAAAVYLYNVVDAIASPYRNTYADLEPAPKTQYLVLAPTEGGALAAVGGTF